MDFDSVLTVLICAVPALAVSLLLGLSLAHVRAGLLPFVVVICSLLALILPSLYLAMLIFRLMGNTNVPEITGFVLTAILFLCGSLGLVAVELHYLAHAPGPRAFGASAVATLCMLPLFVGCFLLESKAQTLITARKLKKESTQFQNTAAQLVHDYELPIPYGFSYPMPTKGVKLDDSPQHVKATSARINIHHMHESSMPAYVWDGKQWKVDEKLAHTPWPKLTNQVARQVATGFLMQGYRVFLARGSKQHTDIADHIITDASQRQPRDYYEPVLTAYKGSVVVTYHIVPQPAPWGSAPLIEVNLHANAKASVNTAGRELKLPLGDKPLFEVWFGRK